MTSSLHPRCSGRRPRSLGGPAFCIRYGKDPQKPSKREGQLRNTFSTTPSKGASVGNSARNRCGQSGKKPAPEFTSGSQKTGCANLNFTVQRSFPVFESVLRATWVQGLSRAATKIQVDVEHTARMSAPLGAAVVILGKWPEEYRSNALLPAATGGSR